ncbi:cobalamin biosynthesis protein CobQ [Ruegeria atlantica]|uniref:cobalamin biosynthesis protein CobQ n=1 Tax=Ruegeria atlantica TaxID=81569 RepID=UPI00147D2729|nr:cobalamin biosynthesis protein CobQ [Ruegeria atlantica]
MNTPSHLLIGAAAFARPARGAILWAAMLGSLLPDLSLFVMVGVSLFILRIPPQVVFDELYFSPAWQTVFAIDNSFILWGLALALGLWRGWRFLTVAASAGLLHLALDFAVHADDGRPQFWPLSDWVFHSPVSYWNSTHHALLVMPVSVAICVGSYVMLWNRGLSVTAKLFFGFLLGAELWVARQWLLFF